MEYCQGGTIVQLIKKTILVFIIICKNNLGTSMEILRDYCV